MWLHAQEKVKEYLLNAGGILVGNIALTDTNPNLVSTLTVIRWAFKGQKHASGMLPAAGVQDKDIREARRFGNTIYRHLHTKNLIDLQRALLSQESVRLKPGLVVLEQRGVKNFRTWSRFILEKGGPGAPERAGRVMMFKNLLIVAIFILSPISSFTAFLKQIIKRNALARDVDYFRQTNFEKGRL